MITCSTLEYQVFYAKTGRDEKAGRRDQQIYINYIKNRIPSLLFVRQSIDIIFLLNVLVLKICPFRF